VRVTGSTYVYGDDPTEAFFRRYGDIDGNGLVDLEVLIHRTGFPRLEYGGDFGMLFNALNRRRGEAGYLDYLDANGDEVIDALDLGQYRIDVVKSIIR
jgi:hypothetical protein